MKKDEGWRERLKDETCQDNLGQDYWGRDERRLERVKSTSES